MRTKTPWSAFVAGVLVSAPQSALSQNTPYENLVLADCGIGLGHNGGATSQEMIYYSGDVWTGNGDATHRPTHMANVPWRGWYPWGPQGGKANMPNGDEWSVWINDKIKDPGAAGDAYHKYEPDKPLKCYSYHKDKVYQLADGKWCSSAYVCNHRGTPNPKSGNGGGGNGGGGKDRLEITSSTNGDAVELYATTAKRIMATVKNTFSANSNACDNTAIGIGSNCKIRWECHTPDSKNKSLFEMAAALDAMASMKQFSTERDSKTQICRRPDTRPGKEGQCMQWEEKVDHYVKIPKSIQTTMSNIPPDGSGRNPSVHGWMNYDITCDKSGLECAICNAIGTALTVPSPSTGVTILLGCQAACS
ncbi:uncharacterized protein B0T15DRAFT_284788 [Chaetomium strumarium]|uniref:Uncharacterized protein n=1 Tax=Chaetomium strumarium TaxID=1170767 RepID=A0AAJ0LZY7_9PEZI|nr:hypothetical protein B0T15DRAFT_284788 [Chaetomium strumarium]